MQDINPEAKRKISLRVMLRALRYRNYRLFFFGQGISLIGTWMSRVATGWLVYRLTDSAAVLGILGFAGQIPSFLLAPFAGVLVDRWDRHRILLITQVLSMVQSFALAGLALAHMITIPQIILLSVFQGVVNAFDVPARQAFVVEMVDNREDLGNAIALNSSMFNGARLVGPSVAGVLIASAGEGMCFLLDGFSYLAVIGSLLAMRIRKRELPLRKESVLQGSMQGLRFVLGFMPIRAILLLVALTGLMGMPYSVLMPVFARNVLHGNAHTFGFLMTVVGIGALTGALFLASRESVRGLGRIICLMTAVFGTGLLLFSQSRVLWLSLPALFVVGFAMMVLTASSNTILQTLVADDMRGRVMGFYAMAFLGMTPFGSLLAGGMADVIGAPATILIDGFVMIAGAAWFARQLPRIRAEARPILIRKGIIPEVAVGIQTASNLTGMPKE